jgi:hypothetical protein
VLSMELTIEVGYIDNSSPANVTANFSVE